MISELFDERWQAYAGTHVRIAHPERGALEVRPAPVGQTLGQFPDQALRTIHIMTAQNPGRPLPDEENQRRQAELVASVRELTGVDAWSAVGGDPAWTHTEDSLAIIGLTDDEALQLARRFDQDAIFAWTSTEWGLVSCRSEQHQGVGWQVLQRS